MTKLQKKVLTAIASGALLMNTVLPAFAVTIEISGNGTDSYNKADVDVTQQTSVVQENKADIDNHVTVNASTGGNEAEKNTGGNVEIKSGDAKSEVTVANTANSNQAEVACCGLGDVDVKISGNGQDSTNKGYVDLTQKTLLSQTNKADIDNDIDAKAKTGGNEAEKNTGGSVEIKSGDATVGVTVATTANANAAMVGGGDPAGTISAWIVGNGADSYNKIDLDLTHGVWVAQTNKADIDNDIDATAKTGYNEAEKNTGGAVSIESGDAAVTVKVDNMANFNWADVDCGGCLLGDLMAKISGNGADSKNKIYADIEGGLDKGYVLGVEQENLLGGSFFPFPCRLPFMKCFPWKQGGLDNDIDATAKTGGNEVEDGTGSVNGDPTIKSGDATGGVIVDNAVNFNSYGSEAPSWFPEFPEIPNLPDIQFGFDFAFLWAWLYGALG